MMDIIFCLASFALGWVLSSWSKDKEIKPTEDLRDCFVLTQDDASALMQSDGEVHSPQELTESVNEADVGVEDSRLWFCDFSYVDDEEQVSDETVCSLKAQRYFLDLFHDGELTLHQRLEGLKAAISIKCSRASYG